LQQTEEEVMELRGKFPVIFISFKDAKVPNWQSCRAHLIREISKQYELHDYLLDSPLLKKTQKIKFENVIYERAEEVDYMDSLKNLCTYLQLYFGQQVVLLIDEYDTPIHTGFAHGFYNEIIVFMRGLFGAVLKDNPSLFKACITGILRVSKESLFSGLNNISVYTTLSVYYAQYFGFTEDEVKKMTDYYQVSDSFGIIRKWYDGYKIGDLSDIYNPWSISNYIARAEGCRPYWVNTASDELLRKEFSRADAEQVRTEIALLLTGVGAEKRIDENFVFLEMGENPELIWTLLYFSGYLTFEKKISIDTVILRIPNFEIEYVFKNIILDWLAKQVKLNSDFLKKTFKYLINNQLEDFEKGLQKIIGDTFSFYDTAKTPEKVYQAYFLGLTAILCEDYYIKSNRESGEGRYDILLLPKDKKMLGIVMEIKQLENIDDEKEAATKKRINAKIKSARTQIQKNQYRKELEVAEVEQILELPIIFLGKVPYVKELKGKK
jgi:hypothetical protein